MNAAEVLAHDLGEWFRAHGTVAPPTVVAALLAHGEQGVAILPDGTLWALEPYIRGVYGDHKHFTILPVSAEAGDTPRVGLLSIGPLVAEAGDTDD